MSCAPGWTWPGSRSASTWRVLEAANLVTVRWRGREKLHYLNAAPISDIAERWISRYDQPRVQALADLKKALEDSPMSKPEFVYTTYISTTPERLWQALTDPAFTKQYWNTSFDTDWAAGSVMTWDNQGVTIADPEQVVLESEPYRRLSYTWHTFTPEFGQAVGFSEDLQWPAGRRAPVQGDVRAGASWRAGQADRRARRFRAGQRDGWHGQPGLAAGDRQPEDPAGDGPAAPGLTGLPALAQLQSC